MEIGKHYESNKRKLGQLREHDWVIALEKCKDHLEWKLRQKTLYGAHTPKNLGEDPFDYYTSYAYEVILSGRWEWKDEFSLSEQLIRIINSRISEEIEKVKREKSEALKIHYMDIEDELYNVGLPTYNPTEEEVEKWERQVKTLEIAIAGHDDLVFFWDCIKEGHKRVEIAGLMDLKLRQLDKLRERFIRTVRSHGGKNR